MRQRAACPLCGFDLDFDTRDGYLITYCPKCRRSVPNHQPKPEVTALYSRVMVDDNDLPKILIGDLGVFLQSYRESRGWSLVQLARFTHVSETTLASFIRHEHKNVSLKTQVRLEDALEISIVGNVIAQPGPKVLSIS